MVPTIVPAVKVSVVVPVLLSVTCAVPVVPTDWSGNVTEAGLMLRLGPLVVPVPDRLTVCGLPVALSVMLMDADRAPATVGVNVTLIVHDALAARLLPHVVVRAKSPLLVPVTAMLLIVSDAPPVLLSVTVDAALVVPTAWFANGRDVGLTVAMGLDVPVPDRLTACGLPAALSVMLIAAARVPVAAGVNVTLIVHDALAARLLPHVVVSAKSPAFVPVTAMLLIVNGAVPVLLSVTAEAVLVVPICWFPNVTDAGLRLTTGLVPLPDRLTPCGLPAALSVMLMAAERAPVAAGVNATLIVHDAPAARLLPHVVEVSAKSPAFVPVIAMALIVNDPVPVLLSVADKAPLVVPTIWVPNPMEAGDRLTDGVAAMPLPASETACGLPVASLRMASDALLAPVAAGANVTARLQLAPTARLVVHVPSAHPNSAGLAPPTVAPAKLIALVPELVSAIA